MPAYLIAEHIITDPTKFEEYRAKVGPMMAKYGARYLTKGAGHKMPEGGHWKPERVRPLIPHCERNSQDATASRCRDCLSQIAFMTDEALWYVRIGEEFASHDSVNHAQNEYARAGEGYRIHTNSAEGYFSILKRGIYGVYQHVSEAHLHRYLASSIFGTTPAPSLATMTGNGR